MALNSGCGCQNHPKETIAISRPGWGINGISGQMVVVATLPLFDDDDDEKSFGLPHATFMLIECDSGVNAQACCCS